MIPRISIALTLFLLIGAAAANQCGNTNGQKYNQVDCECGSSSKGQQCDQSTGLFCNIHGEIGKCSGMPQCSEQTGAYANGADCACGLTAQCTAASGSGMFCRIDKEKNEGTCSTTFAKEACSKYRAPADENMCCMSYRKGAESNPTHTNSKSECRGVSADGSEELKWEKSTKCRKICIPGTFGKDTGGKITCVDCPAGYVSGELDGKCPHEDHHCTACSNGEYSSVVGGTKCQGE
jgi:hypothetical protein